MPGKLSKSVALPDVMIYPDRARLLRWILLIVLIFLLFVALLIGIPIGLHYYSHGSSAHFGKAIMAAVFGIPVGIFGILFSGFWLVGLLSYLIAKRPSIRISAAGIEDHCSLLSFGVGLIPWQNIAAIYPMTITYSSRLTQSQYSYLRIVPINLEAQLGANSARSVLIRLLRMGMAQSNGIQLPEMYFSQPATQVAQSIQAYYEHIREQQSLHTIVFPGVSTSTPPADYSMEPLPSVRNFDQAEADREALDR